MNPARAIEPLRWGVLGVSELAGRRAVLPALQRSRTARLVTIGSRDRMRAAREARLFGAWRGVESYDAVLADPDVEAVYIPLPNGLHRPWVEAAAAAGKHVLCEKPLAMNAAEARAMVSACEAAGVVLMEAYMTPFHPRDRVLRELCAAGRLGTIRNIAATFTFAARDRFNHRFDPILGGGALLDLGIYCLAPLLAIIGPPAVWSAARIPATTGVDATFAAWLRFGEGVAASILVSFELPETQWLIVAGTQGRVSLEHAFTPTPDEARFEIERSDGLTEVVESGGNDPYLAMVEHFAGVVRGLEAPSRPPATSVALLELIDALRAAADH